MLRVLAEAKTPNAVFFGGDIHSYWVTDLKADFDDPASATVATEFVGTSITSDNPGPPFTQQAGMIQGDFIKYVNLETHGYMTAEVTPERMTTRFRTVSDRKDKAATISTLKSWVVESGKAGAVEA